MHELALAQSVVKIVCEEAERHGLCRVEGFKLQVGQLRAVVPELLETCLEVAGHGTLAEGARVELAVVPGRARCTCGEEFAIEELLYLCPACGEPGAAVTQGQELALVEIEGSPGGTEGDES